MCFCRTEEEFKPEVIEEANDLDESLAKRKHDETKNESEVDETIKKLKVVESVLDDIK